MANYELDRPAPPNLPLAPVDYDTRYQDQLNSVSRLYYNRLNELLNNILIGSGGRYIGFPFGSFYSTADQTATAANTGYAITYSNTDISNDVSVQSSSQIKVTQYGIYNIQFSIQFVNTDTQLQDVDIWFRKNGNDISNSNSRFSIPNSHGGVDGHFIAALNFFIDLDPTDYVQLMWLTSSTAVSIQHLDAVTTPSAAVRPATPSVILTVAFVSRPV